MEFHENIERLLIHLDVRHFTTTELCDVGRTHPEGVVLLAPPVFLDRNIIPTIVRVEQVRRQLDGRLRVQSGYRSPAYNRVVGGTSGSMHLEFNALDLVPLDHTLDELWEALMAFPRASEWAGCKLYRDRGFIHFDTRGLIDPSDDPWIVPG